MCEWIITWLAFIMFRSFSLGEAETAILRVAAIVDPVSEQAQRWSAVLKVASDRFFVAHQM